MAMRYNPPPNWPAPPQGWTPPPGWAPDPAWGPAPAGWRVFVDDQAAVDAPAKKRSWFRRHKILTGLAGLFVIGVISTAAGGGGGDTSATPASTTTAATPSPSTSSSTSSTTPAAAPSSSSTSPAPVAPALAKDVAYSGRGQKVLRIKKPETGAILAVITHKGSSNFAVTPLDGSNQQTGLLVNEIGSFKGTVLLDKDGNETAKLKIDADGTWTVVLKALAKARPMGTGTSGRGPDVLLYRGKAVDIKLTHTGSSNFAVTYINSDSGDLLVNEIGKYSGEVPLTDGPGVLQIEADGKWTAAVLK